MTLMSALGRAARLGRVRLSLEVAEHRSGIDPEITIQMITSMPNFAEFNSLAYMHTVIPNLKNLGLITERTRDQWLKLGMMTPGKNPMLEEVLTHGEDPVSR